MTECELQKLRIDLIEINMEQKNCLGRVIDLSTYKLIVKLLNNYIYLQKKYENVNDAYKNFVFSIVNSMVEDKRFNKVVEIIDGVLNEQ